MESGAEARLFRTWLVLCGITVFSFWLGSGQAQHAEQSANAPVTYLALLIVSIKVRIIVSEFMEARRWSKKLQLAMDGWLVALLISLAAIYALKLDMPTV